MSTFNKRELLSLINYSHHWHLFLDSWRIILPAIVYSIWAAFISSFKKTSLLSKTWFHEFVSKLFSAVSCTSLTFFFYLFIIPPIHSKSQNFMFVPSLSPFPTNSIQNSSELLFLPGGFVGLSPRRRRRSDVDSRNATPPQRPNSSSPRRSPSKTRPPRAAPHPPRRDDPAPRSATEGSVPHTSQKFHEISIKC